MGSQEEGKDPAGTAGPPKYVVTNRPLAGTRKRGRTAAEDLALERELLADEKERAEHIMLVDLERNDLGRICRSGSVQVSEMMALEEYSHVIHIVSQVGGRLQPGAGAVDVIRAMADVPGGIVGAGTLLTPADVVAAKAAGARFGVSPGVTERLLDACLEAELHFCPEPPPPRK